MEKCQESVWNLGFGAPFLRQVVADQPVVLVDGPTLPTASKHGFAALATCILEAVEGFRKNNCRKFRHAFLGGH